MSIIKEVHAFAGIMEALAPDPLVEVYFGMTQLTVEPSDLKGYLLRFKSGLTVRQNKVGHLQVSIRPVDDKRAMDLLTSYSYHTINMYMHNFDKQFVLAQNLGVYEIGDNYLNYRWYFDTD